MRGKPVHYNNASLGAKMQDHNLANQINQQTLGLAKGLNSFPTTVPLLGYAQGGIIEGPGTGTSDSIPAKLPIESAIIPAHIVEMYGKDYFDKLEAAAPKTGKDKGEVNAKVSDGEYQLSADAVAHWGQDFITKLIASDKETPAENAMPGEEMAEMMPSEKVPGYRDGGVVEEPLPSLRDRAMNTAGSNAEFRQRNPEFGNNFARDNAPAPSLSERATTNTPLAQPAQTGLRGRLGMPESTVTPAQPQLGLRERVMTNAPAPEQVAQSGLRGRLGMPEAPAQPASAPTPSLRDRVFAPNNNTVRTGFGRNLPDSSVQTPKVNPWEAEMQGAGGQGLSARVGSMANKFAGAAGAVGSLAGIAAVAAEPSEGDNYLAARSDAQAQQALASGGFNPIASKLKAPINAGMEAVGDAFNKNIGYPAVLGIDRLLTRNQGQATPVNAPETVAAQPNPAPQSVLAPAVNQPQGLAGTATTDNPTPNPTLAPQNKYDFAQVQGGNRVQLTPEYNAQLNAQDTRTIAQRDATNATPEQIAGVQQSAPTLGGLGARARSLDNGGAWLAASPEEIAQTNKDQHELSRAINLTSLMNRSGLPLPQQQQENNYAAENELARAGLAEKVRESNLNREAASSTAAAANALEREKLSRDQFGAINEKQYDDMGTVKGEAARIWNKTTGQFVDANAGALQSKYQQQAIDELSSGDSASQEDAKAYLMQYFPKVYQKMFGKSQG